jgi:alanine-glyoxylate transaminase/serine-glyoxylate transaminase/serine-pyruvate transaminase
MLKQVLYAEKEGSQSVLIAGSGTMGWDAVGANLIERGDEAVSCFSFSIQRRG